MFNLQPDLSGNPFLLVLNFYLMNNRLAKKIGSGRRIKLPQITCNELNVNYLILYLYFLYIILTFAPRIIIKIYKQCLQL